MCDLNGRMCWNGDFVSFDMRMGEKPELEKNMQGTLYWNYLIKKIIKNTAIKVAKMTVTQFHV